MRVDNTTTKLCVVYQPLDLTKELFLVDSLTYFGKFIFCKFKRDIRESHLSDCVGELVDSCNMNIEIIIDKNAPQQIKNVVLRHFIWGKSLDKLIMVEVAEVVTTINQLATKPCESGLLPTWLLKECIDERAPINNMFY